MVEVTPEAAAPDGMTWQEAHTAVQLQLAKREEEMRRLTRDSLQTVAVARATEANFKRLAAWHQHWKNRSVRYGGALGRLRTYLEANGDLIPAELVGEMMQIIAAPHIQDGVDCDCGPACPVNAAQPHTTMEAYKVERATEAGG